MGAMIIAFISDRCLAQGAHITELQIVVQTKWEVKGVLLD